MPKTAPHSNSCLALPRWLIPTMASFAMTFCGANANADKIVPATYDVDSYMFVGLNSNAEWGLSVSTDYSLGEVGQNNAHFIFANIQFGDLSSLKTKAAGGGDKFLELATYNFPGPSTIAVSIAKADIEADNGTGYPSPLFIGNGFLTGTNTDRLRWYMANIKGDNAAYGGYAGGAPHVGVLQINAAGTHRLDVTTAVDSWISGERPNFGFGIWSAADAGEQGNTFDFVSLDNVARPNDGPKLVITGESSAPMMGDINGDTVVDRADLAQLMASFGIASGATWADGDFDGNGAVTLVDVMMLKSHFTPTAPSSAAAVPEPSSLAISILGGVGMAIWASRRRRTRKITALDLLGRLRLSRP
jgi:hypothetical protein